MPVNGNGSSKEEIIREAMRRELDQIKAPPPEMMWKRIQAGLTQDKRATPIRRGYSWRRFSAAAAALLIFIFGGLAAHRIMQGSFPGQGRLDNDAAEERVDLITAAEDSAETLLGDWRELEPPQVSFTDAGEWPPAALNRSFTLEQTAGWESGGDLLYAAVYDRDGDQVIWIRPASGTLELEALLLQLPALFGHQIELQGFEDGLTWFSIAGRPGLVWQQGECSCALLVSHGSLTPEFLRALFDSTLSASD